MIAFFSKVSSRLCNRHVIQLMCRLDQEGMTDGYLALLKNRWFNLHWQQHSNVQKWTETKMLVEQENREVVVDQAYVQCEWPSWTCAIPDMVYPIWHEERELLPPVFHRYCQEEHYHHLRDSFVTNIFLKRTFPDIQQLRHSLLFSSSIKLLKSSDDTGWGDITTVYDIRLQGILTRPTFWWLTLITRLQSKCKRKAVN